MRKPMLIVMTRWPAPKRCKSRLAKDIGFYRAAHIQRRLTNHTIAVAQQIKSKGLLEIKLAIDGIGQKKINQYAKYNGVNLACSQGEGSLGLKMKRQILKAQRNRRSKSKKTRDTIIIGTDVPNLCEADILYALYYLRENELVIGPAKDGGYWLIGFSGDIIKPSISWPFAGINWGCSSVLAETLKMIHLKAIKYKLLTLKNDIDLTNDLSLWQK